MAEIRYEHVRGVQVHALAEELSDVSPLRVFSCHATDAVAAYADEQLVGLFLYCLQRGRAGTRVLDACGTFVRPRYRRRGVGAALWTRALTRTRVRTATAFIVSSHAVRMLRTVEKQNPHVRLLLSFDLGPRGGEMRSGWAWRRDHGEV